MESLTIQYAFPFYYVSCDGLMAYCADVTTSELYTPGESYQGSHNPKRNIVLTFAVRRREYWELRNEVYSIFGMPGTLTWYPDEGEQRSIEYYVESIEFSDPNTRGFRQCSVSFICPFPFFSGAEKTVRLSYWKPLFILPGVMNSPFRLGERVAQQLVNIYNPQPVQIGMKIKFTALGNVINPSLKNVASGEQFKLSASLSVGSGIAVNTQNGQKGAYYIDEPQPFSLWDYELNDWIQLRPGNNILQYGADTGAEFLDVSIEYSQLYLGG